MRELQETCEPEKQASLCRRFVAFFVCFFACFLVVLRLRVRLATQIASGVESGGVDPFAGVSLMEDYIREANRFGNISVKTHQSYLKHFLLTALLTTKMV